MVQIRARTQGDGYYLKYGMKIQNGEEKKMLKQ